MPTKTGDKVRIIVLGTGPDAETARLIAESDADVALAKQFTKTVTHLVVDDTVKPTEARLKKAEEAGVPVLTFDEFKALLVAGAEDEVEEAEVEEVAVEEAVEAELEEAPAAAVDPEPEPEPAAEAVEPEPVEEPEPVADPEPEATVETTVEADAVETEAEPETEPVAEAVESTPDDTAGDDTAKDETVEPVAEAIDEPEEVPADPEKTVPSQADAPAIENDEKGAKPSLLDKIKSIFGLSTAKK